MEFTAYNLYNGSILYLNFLIPTKIIIKDLNNEGVDFMSFDFLKDKDKKVHFIGIGGISMSGLAAVLLNSGFKVSGSDFKNSPIVEKLKAEGLLSEGDMVVLSGGASALKKEEKGKVIGGCVRI